jgi:hypothetical protein
MSSHSPYRVGVRQRCKKKKKTDQRNTDSGIVGELPLQCCKRKDAGWGTGEWDETTRQIQNRSRVLLLDLEAPPGRLRLRHGIARQAAPPLSVGHYRRGGGSVRHAP